MKHMKKTLYLLPVALLSLIWLSGCQRDTPEPAPLTDNVIAVFEGGNLTAEFLEAHKKSMSRQSKYRRNPELLTREAVFNHALNMEMIIAEGHRVGLDQHPFIKQQLHKYKSELFLDIMKHDLIKEIDRETISDEKARAFYEEEKESYLRQPLYSVQFFTVNPELAADLSEKISGAGEVDIAALAALFADNEKDRQDGGTRVSRSLRRFQPEWRSVVEDLEVGRVTGAIQIGDKFYVMMLSHKTEPYQYTFEEKKEYIRNDVLLNMYREQWQNVYARLKEEFKVEIDKIKLAAFLSGKVEEKEITKAEGE